MIDRTHALPIVRQGQILELARSAAYYQATLVSPDEWALIRRIDALHLEHPFGGARMLSKMLKQAGHPVGRRRVSMTCIASPTPAHGIRYIPTSCAI